MRILYIVFLLFQLPQSNWYLNFADAQLESVKTHKMMLINFSGSDWCGPCIREKKEIFGSSVFEAYAAAHLILVSADFPRQKQHELSPEQTKRNEALADIYNPDGKFPYTLLINEKGRTLMAWDGIPEGGTEIFIKQISDLENGLR